MQVSVSRAVTLLTPAFSAGAAIGAAWLAKHFPGLPPMSPTDITAIEVSAFVTTTGIAAKWLHGNAQWEQLVEAWRLVKSQDQQAKAAVVPAAAVKQLAPIVPMAPDTRDQGWPPSTTPAA